jgi:hypothetical protein
MSRRKLTVGVVAGVAIVAFVAAVDQSRWSAHFKGVAAPSSIGAAVESVNRSTRLAVELARLNPPGSSGNNADIDCVSLDSVEFTYQVRNRGGSRITGLKVGTKCACESVGDPPADIAPGESGTISFRLRAPRAGRMNRQIPLLSDGADEPLAVLDISLRVNFDRPVLIPPPSALSFTFVAGKTAAHELVLEAIEARDAKHWISGLELDPSDGVELQPFQVEELPEADPSLTRRRYSFPLVNRSLAVGRHSATAAIRTSDDSSAVRDPFTLELNVTDPVALAPNPLVIKYDRGSMPTSRRVSIINRTGGRAVAKPVNYDADLLRVAAAGEQSGSTAAFDVSPAGMPESRVETQVVFDTGDDQTRILVVRFEPSEGP